MSDLVLNGLDLNDNTNYTTTALDMPPPPKRPQWVNNPDADGDLLLAEAHYERRTITLSVRVAQQATMDLAAAKIAALEDQLQLAERTQDGLPLVWTPPGRSGTYTYTFYVMLGEITDIATD